MRIRNFSPGLLTLLVCSCAGTSLKQTWKSPEYQKGPVNKVAAVAVDDRGMVRQAFENRFVTQLEKHGTSALTTFNLLSPAEIKADKAAAVERLQAAGADSVLIVRLVDSTFSYSEVHVGSSNWGPYDTWYDYFALAYGIGPSYGSLEQKTSLETSLFELKTGKRIWSGLTDTVSKYNTDRVAEIDKVVAKVVAAMHKDGIIH
jgi:hypothetical protein